MINNAPRNKLAISLLENNKLVRSFRNMIHNNLSQSFEVLFIKIFNYRTSQTNLFTSDKNWKDVKFNDRKEKSKDKIAFQKKFVSKHEYFI